MTLPSLCRYWLDRAHARVQQALSSGSPALFVAAVAAYEELLADMPLMTEGR